MLFYCLPELSAVEEPSTQHTVHRMYKYIPSYCDSFQTVMREIIRFV